MSEKLLYITASSQMEAEKIAKGLVEKRLAACTNIISGVRSFYWWNGKMEEDGEWIILGKTLQAREAEIIQAVGELHSAECPCVIFLPIDGGAKPFLSWIGEQARGENG